MAGAAHLATTLDIEMIGFERIASPNTPDADLIVRSGDEVWQEIGGRALIRYCTKADVGTFRSGTNRKIFTTPTPYEPDDVIKWLELPGVMTQRPFALVLDPRELVEVAGPRWVRWGLGVEYILLGGFEAKAIKTEWEVSLL